VDRGGRPEGIGGLAQELLHLGAADVVAPPLEDVEVVPIEGEARLDPRPGAELVDADRQQLRLGERGRRVDPAPQAAASILPCGRLLVGAVDRVEHVGVDVHPAVGGLDRLGGGEPVGEGRGTVGQVSPELRQVGQPALDGTELLLPQGRGWKDAGGVPGVLDRDVPAGGDGGLRHLVSGP